MNKYTKPSAQVVELSVKESLSALFQKERTFGFGSNSKTLNVNLYTANSISNVKLEKASEA